MTLNLLMNVIRKISAKNLWKFFWFQVQLGNELQGFTFGKAINSTINQV